MRLLGVDVGFSKTRPTTGIAFLDGETLTVCRAKTDWRDRRDKLADGFAPDFLAIDGPLLPLGVGARATRHCESLFSRTPFHDRCKPGMSHYGKGLELREAAGDALAQFRGLLTRKTKEPARRISRRGRVVEAFPNLFLGVFVSDAEYSRRPNFRRGGRFDWLYDRVAKSGVLEEELSNHISLPRDVWTKIRRERDHEHRAALICLLTAALVAQRKAAVIGSKDGGWFWLPPVSGWQPWAVDGLDRSVRHLRANGAVIDGWPHSISK